MGRHDIPDNSDAGQSGDASHENQAAKRLNDASGAWSKPTDSPTTPATSDQTKTQSVDNAQPGAHLQFDKNGTYMGIYNSDGSVSSVSDWKPDPTLAAKTHEAAQHWNEGEWAKHVGDPKPTTPEFNPDEWVKKVTKEHAESEAKHQQAPQDSPVTPQRAPEVVTPNQEPAVAPDRMAGVTSKQDVEAFLSRMQGQPEAVFNRPVFQQPVDQMGYGDQPMPMMGDQMMMMPPYGTQPYFNPGYGPGMFVRPYHQHHGFLHSIENLLFQMENPMGYGNLGMMGMPMGGMPFGGMGFRMPIGGMPFGHMPFHVPYIPMGGGGLLGNLMRGIRF